MNAYAQTFPAFPHRPVITEAVDKITECRVCGSDFFANPLLSYENMPAVAQFLPLPGDIDLGVRLEIMQCSGCGLVQTANPAVSYWREVIRTAGLSAEMNAFRARQFERWIDENELLGKNLLEYGCGRGEYLRVFAGAGVNAYGLEARVSSVHVCRAEGLQAWIGSFDNQNISHPQGPFDAFAILNFLEHIPQPNTVLAAIRNNLVDGAVGLVEVPNFDKILTHNHFSEFMTDHIFYFTRETLTRTLEANGFEVVGVDSVWHGDILSATVRKREQMNLSAFGATQTRIGTEVNAWLDAHQPAAVWGAGHQSLAVINMLGLAGKVRYVVDSAPYKQGKITPASHLPIAAPSRLQEDLVSGVLVMAAGYSDEVVRILRRDYDPKIAVAILRENGLEMIV